MDEDGYTSVLQELPEKDGIYDVIFKWSEKINAYGECYWKLGKWMCNTELCGALTHWKEAEEYYWPYEPLDA